MSPPGSGRRAAVFGAGQIGAAVGRKLLADGWSFVALFTRSAQSARRLMAQDWVQEAHARGRVEVGYGDLLLGHEVVLTDGDVLIGHRPAELMRAAAEHVAADDIIQATNVASHLPAGDATRDGDGDASIALVLDLMCRQLEHIYHLLKGAPETRFLQVSTTALGGMGLNIPFTHGDDNEELLSPGLWRKLQLSGAQHQVLWALGRSFPGRVHLVVPATAVGFEEAPPTRSGLIAAGEGKLYSLPEIRLLTHPAMMGLTTKEVVADTVVSILSGADHKADLLAAMDSATLGSSAEGRAVLEGLLERAPADGWDTTGSLGPRVTDRLRTVIALLEQAGDGNLAELLETMEQRAPGRVGTGAEWLDQLRRYLMSPRGQAIGTLPARRVDAGHLLAEVLAAEGWGRPDRNQPEQQPHVYRIGKERQVIER